MSSVKLSRCSFKSLSGRSFAGTLANTFSNPLSNTLANTRTVLAAIAFFAIAATGSLASHADDLPVLPLTVNVNTADARTIANVLQGIGLSRASAIVAYREQNGAFSSVDALTAVKGVGDRTVELNATRILLTD